MSYTHTLKNTFFISAVTFSLGFFVLFSNPALVSAQSFNSQFTPQTNEQLIAYLFGIIAQLQSQSGNTTVSQIGSGQVLGATNSLTSSTRKIDVITRAVRNTTEDETTLTGRVFLNENTFARVWFEYGDDGSSDDESTVKRSVSGTGSVDFSVRIDDLDERTVYYYRAVAEDRNGNRVRGVARSFFTQGDFDRSGDDEPDVDTRSARDIDEESAELRGSVDMNDFRNGLVFFVYGEDEDLIEEVEDEDEFDDVDEEGDDLQKERIDNDLDDSDSYTERVRGLDDDTEYFYRICVEYEDEDDDEALECGDVEEFETDR